MGLDESLDEPLEQKILQCIKSNPKITYQMLAEELLVSRSAIQRGITKLAESGRLERKDAGIYRPWRRYYG
jgi:DeoR/GlpR family transcriptional regulator of sugar metabolism